MNTRIPTLRLTVLATLMAAATLTACSGQQTRSTPEPDPLSHVDPTVDHTATDHTRWVTTITSDETDPMLLEPVEMPEVDISSTMAAAEDLYTTRPARLTFNFAFDQSQLDDENRQIVEQHGRFLAEHPEIRLVINGHTDTQGNSHYNDVLAQKRAEHVAELLQQQGVMKEQIEILGWGSSAPLADAQHHREQRRVELKYVDEYWVQTSHE